MKTLTEEKMEILYQGSLRDIRELMMRLEQGNEVQEKTVAAVERLVMQVEEMERRHARPGAALKLGLRALVLDICKIAGGSTVAILTLKALGVSL